MILDAETLDLTSGIDELVGDVPVGAVKPELHQCVLEIATEVCSDVAEAGVQLRALRRHVAQRAAAKGLAIASAGTHPFARWEDQRISPDERYRQLIDHIGIVARQELIFGLHVHVGIDDPDKAVHVANGMREHLPLLLALSANSPFWRSERTGLASARTPIFRQFPRVGVPPYFASWEDWQARMAFMIESRTIEDHTWMWYDVRIHPRFGTVEVRAMDAQTRVEHTLALVALVQALARALAEHHDGGAALDDHPYELLDENRWLAARHGLDGELVDLPSPERVRSRDLAERVLEHVRPHAEALRGAEALEGVRDLLDRGTGADRQRLVYEANRDLHELVRDLVEATTG